MMKYIFSVLMLFVAPISAHAGAIEKLKTFIAATHSAQANFTQEVLDQNGKHIQSASGIMQFQRPGKFRWSYQKPYEQLIVCLLYTSDAADDLTRVDLCGRRII